MGATKTNIMIGILVLIIAGLSVSLYRVTRLRKVLYEVRDRVPVKVPLDVFVTEFAEAVDQHDQQWRNVAAQNAWLRRHLEQTLSKLETDYKLEPIPVKTAYPRQGALLSDYIKYPQWFVIPYEKPEYSSGIKDPNEYGLLNLKDYMDRTTMFLGFEIGDTEFWIVNFYERLKRLEQAMQAAKKEESQSELSR